MKKNSLKAVFLVLHHRFGDVIHFALDKVHVTLPYKYFWIHHKTKQSNQILWIFSFQQFKKC